MPPVNRNKPVRAESSDSRWSLMEFLRDFPDDAACLNWLWRERFSEDGSHAECPSCERVRKFHKVKDRPAWDCDSCGHHMHPTAGTIFHKSSTSLHLWFYAMHLMTSTRCGISAKQMERELGCNYKTAARMMRLIRTELMAQDDEPLSGEVEADETFIGGQPRQGEIERYRREGDWNRQKAASRWAADPKNKATVFGMVERGGRVRAQVVPSRQGVTLDALMVTHILPESTIFTDEMRSYIKIGRKFAGHHRIRHKAHIYVSGNVHTNTIEGVFSLIKNGIRGTYHAVSQKWLQSYLNEYVWRYNTRQDERSQFEQLLLRAARG
jgi:transposase-like protein